MRKVSLGIIGKPPELGHPDVQACAVHAEIGHAEGSDLGGDEVLFPCASWSQAEALIDCLRELLDLVEKES